MGAVVRVDDLKRAAHEDAAGFAELHGPSVAEKQLGAEFPLERGHVLAEGRLRDVQRLCRFCVVEAARQLDKLAIEVDVHCVPLSLDRAFPLVIIVARGQ